MSRQGGSRGSGNARWRALFPVWVDHVGPAVDVRIRESRIGRRTHRVIQPAVAAGDAAQRMVAHRNFTHDQLRRSVHAIDFPEAVAVIADVRAAILRAIRNLVQREGLEGPKSDVIADQSALLVVDLHVRLVDAFRRESEGVAGDGNPDVVLAVHRDRSNGIDSGCKHTDFVARRNLDLARIRFHRRTDGPLAGWTARFNLAPILGKRSSRAQAGSHCGYRCISQYFHFPLLLRFVACC